LVPVTVWGSNGYLFGFMPSTEKVGFLVHNRCPSVSLLTLDDFATAYAASSRRLFGGLISPSLPPDNLEHSMQFELFVTAVAHYSTEVLCAQLEAQLLAPGSALPIPTFPSFRFSNEQTYLTGEQLLSHAPPPLPVSTVPLHSQSLEPLAPQIASFAPSYTTSRPLHSHPFEPLAPPIASFAPSHTTSRPLHSHPFEPLAPPTAPSAPSLTTSRNLNVVLKKTETFISTSPRHSTFQPQHARLHHVSSTKH
jgi:hypothetical protein